MPKWLKGTLAPTLMLWLYALAFGAVSGMYPGGRLPGIADYAAQAAFALVIASWVAADAQKREQRPCYDHDSFIYFAWPIVVPVYLFRTRGWRAFLTLLCFAGIWLVAVIAAAAAYVVRAFVS